jgi:hypothetical protein
MADTSIVINKVEEKKISSKGNEEFVQRITYYTRDANDFKATSEIKKIKEKKTIKQEVAERMKIPKFGVCKGQPRGSLEAGVIMISKEEVKIINRESDMEGDMREKLLDSINSRKKNVLREMQEIKEKEKQEKLAKLFSSTKQATTIRRNRPRENSVRVSGFNPRYTEKDLYSLFEQAGRIRKVYIPRDFYTGQFKNFAFIDFDQSIAVGNAVEMYNDVAVDECVLTVAPADENK